MNIAIVGAGISGLATAWSLAKAGHRVALFEQGAIPNPLSASGDQHRIIRRGYAGQDGYARTVRDAFAAWEDLWADIGARHYRETGVLCVSRWPGDEGDRFTQGYDRMGTPYEKYGSEAAAERFPFLDPENVDYASVNAEGGALFCQRIARDLATWLRGAGVEIRDGALVASVDAAAGAVTVDGETRAFDAVVVAAGAWATRLFPDLQDRLTTYRTAVVYLDPPSDLAEAWSAAPTILSVGGDAVDGYGLPPVDGTDLKFGAGIHRVPAAADERREEEPGEAIRLRNHFSPPIARIDEYAVKSLVTCAYTFTADERFLAERRGKAWIVSACSGHGYKFGAAVGQRVARAVETRDEEALLHWIEAR